MTRLFFLLACLTLVLWAEPSVSAQPTGFQVVVHPSNPLTEVKRSQLAQLFFKKTTTWESGQPAHPVDLGEDSPVRAAFCDEVLKRSLPAVRAYWQQRIFSGRDVPPPEKPTDTDVLAFVRSNSGAVGYVSAGTSTQGVKVLVVVD